MMHTPNNTVFIHPHIRRARQLAYLLDSAIHIPFLNKRIGLDPLIGLVPALGDAIAVLLSSYLLWVAYELKLPKMVLVRMILNLVVDTTVGNVPVVGDIFDFMWKANQRNMRILEEAYFRHHHPRRVQEAMAQTVAPLTPVPASEEVLEAIYQAR
jgi:hypothetical protein